MPGKTTVITFFGENLAGTTELWTSFSAQKIELASPEQNRLETGRVSFCVSVGKEVPVGIGAVRLSTTNGITGLQFVMIDNLPSIAKSGRNASIQTAQELKLPVAVDGNCDEHNSDYYQITAQKGERITVEVVAQRLGSMLDPVVRLLDYRGRELEFHEDTPGLGSDVRFTHQFSTRGKYFIELRDTRYEGGNKHRYRLRVTDSPGALIPFLPLREPIFEPVEMVPASERSELEPNDTMPNAMKLDIPVTIHGQFQQSGDRDWYGLQVEKGQRLLFSGKTRSFGSPCDLFMELYDAKGARLAEANVSGPDEGRLTNTFGEASTYFLMIEELNRRGGPELAYRLEIHPYRPGFDLSVETNRVEATPGGSCELKVTCARREFEGSVTLSLTGAARWFSVTNNILPAKTNETRLAITLPLNLIPGQILNLGIIGEGQIGEENFQTHASTSPVLRKLFPLILYPPQELDGLIGLGIKALAKPRTNQPPEKGSDGK